MYCTDAQHFGRSGWGWCPRARGGSRTCACLCARFGGMSALVGFGNEATGVAGQRPRAGALEGCHPISPILPLRTNLELCDYAVIKGIDHHCNFQPTRKAHSQTNGTEALIRGLSVTMIDSPVAQVVQELAEGAQPAWTPPSGQRRVFWLVSDAVFWPEHSRWALCAVPASPARSDRRFNRELVFLNTVRRAFVSEERRPTEDHGWRGLASGGWAAGPVGLVVSEARAGWMQSRRRS